jgi:hypothetical protein
MVTLKGCSHTIHDAVPIGYEGKRPTGMTKNKEEENEVLDLKCGTLRLQWKP